MTLNDRTSMMQPPQADNQGKYINNEKGSYFRFDYDDDNMSYKYVSSITWMNRCNTYNPSYCNGNE